MQRVHQRQQIGPGRKVQPVEPKRHRGALIADQFPQEVGGALDRRAFRPRVTADAKRGTGVAKADRQHRAEGPGARGTDLVHCLEGTLGVGAFDALEQRGRPARVNLVLERQWPLADAAPQRREVEAVLR